MTKSKLLILQAEMLTVLELGEAVLQIAVGPGWEAGSQQQGLRLFVLEAWGESCEAPWKDSGGISGMRTVRLSLYLDIPCSLPFGDQGPHIKGSRPPRPWEG